MTEFRYFVESQPVITESPKHFLDCCHNRTEPVSNARQGAELIRILNAIYESAETGKEILF